MNIDKNWPSSGVHPIMEGHARKQLEAMGITDETLQLFVNSINDDLQNLVAGQYQLSLEISREPEGGHRECRTVIHLESDSPRVFEGTPLYEEMVEFEKTGKPTATMVAVMNATLSIRTLELFSDMAEERGMKIQFEAIVLDTDHGKAPQLSAQIVPLVEV